MGDAAVSTLVKDLSGRLTSIICLEEFGLLKDDLSTLKDDFSQIVDVLHDAEEKRCKNKEVDSWLKSLRCASLMVENVLDDILTEAKIQRVHKQRGIKYRVRAAFSSAHNQLMFRVRISQKVKAIRRTLGDITFKISHLSLSPGAASHVDVDVTGEMPDRETSAMIHDSTLIWGRNEEVEMIVKGLCNKDVGKYDDGKIPVYGILGMGGVGKTTLARSVYNHKRVNQYFDLKCWVYTSRNFHVKEIIRDIIAVIDKRECTLTHLDVLLDSLRNKLRGKKFFIVLINVWIEGDESPKWDLLSEALSYGCKGSMVLMTTRLRTTIEIMAKVPRLRHQPSLLTPADSWSLFNKFAFAGERERDDIRELEHIGMRIVMKCGGVPLALKTLGSLMWSKTSIRDWQHVIENSILESEETYISPALQLSYEELFPHIKQCFVYCCLFPKGYDMEKDVVIQLWVVNGFIPPKGDIDLYVLGEEIFDYLVWRAFFRVVRYKKYSNDRYQMHNQMHDLALYVMRHECLSIERKHNDNKEVIIPDEALHLSSSCPDIVFSSQDLGKSTLLRSLFMFEEAYHDLITVIQSYNHVYLRVLYLCGIGLKTLPASIFKLKHLKYLNLSHSCIQVLPETIIYLQNLQVLLLNSCNQLCELPENLRYISSLKLLDISSCPSLLHLPFGIKEIKNLQRLPRFHVGKKTGAEIGELGYLDRLKGELEISGLENVGTLSEAKSANLIGKRSLSALKFSWSNINIRERKLEMFEHDQDIIEGLEPDLSLKKLSIYFYMGKIISPSWIVKLRNLDEIGFSGCKRCESIPPLGNLPNLRVIKLLGMDSLEGFDDEDMSNTFLRLQELNIFMCPNLFSLPSNLPSLKILKLEECGALNSLPGGMQSLKQLEISGCKHLSEKCERDKGEDWQKISHIPNIRIDSQVTSEDEEDEINHDDW